MRRVLLTAAKAITLIIAIGCLVSFLAWVKLTYFGDPATHFHDTAALSTLSPYFRIGLAVAVAMIVATAAIAWANDLRVAIRSRRGKE